MVVVVGKSPNQIEVMKTLIRGSKTFGCLALSDCLVEAKIGTTAEIFECRELPLDSIEVEFKLKVSAAQCLVIFMTFDPAGHLRSY